MYPAEKKLTSERKKAQDPNSKWKITIKLIVIFHFELGSCAFFLSEVNFFSAGYTHVHVQYEKKAVTFNVTAFFLSLSGYHYTHVVEANVTVPSTLYA